MYQKGKKLAMIVAIDLSYIYSWVMHGTAKSRQTFISYNEFI